MRYDGRSMVVTVLVQPRERNQLEFNAINSNLMQP